MAAPAVERHRALRTAVLTTLVLGLGVGAHGLAGGALPAPGVLLALSVVVTCSAAVPAGRRLPARAAAPLLAAGQVLLHHVLAALAGPTATGAALPGTPGPGTGCSGGAAPGHAHAASLCSSAVEAARWSAGPGAVDHALHATHAGTTATAMVVGHALATAVAALLLSRSDAAAAALVSWLRPLSALPTAPSVPVARRPGPPGPEPVLARVPALLDLALRRRGPPRRPGPTPAPAS